jgi:hypothetical protein
MSKWLGKNGGVMKLKNLFPRRQRRQLVRRFGRAELVRLANGQHELLGGTDADRAAAYEWTSLFAHEIVFTHFHREETVRCRSRQPWFPVRLQPAL